LRWNASLARAVIHIFPEIGTLPDMIQLFRKSDRLSGFYYK